MKYEPWSAETYLKALQANSEPPLNAESGTVLNKIYSAMARTLAAHDNCVAEIVNDPAFSGRVETVGRSREHMFGFGKRSHSPDARELSARVDENLSMSRQRAHQLMENVPVPARCEIRCNSCGTIHVGEGATSSMAKGQAVHMAMAHRCIGVVPERPSFQEVRAVSVAKAATRCTCDMQLLMVAGCRCGGA